VKNYFENTEHMLRVTMASKKAKRYTDAQRQEILGFIEVQGHGGQTKAIKKYKVTAASIAAWKKKSGGASSTKPGKSSASKELRAVQELRSILMEIEATENKLVDLRKRYAKAKTRI
jgi:hypothetical protein